MDGVDIRRSTLARVVRDPSWRPAVASPEGRALKELSEIGWVVIEVDSFSYRVHLTERGLQRHRDWGDDQPLRTRSDEASSV